MQYTDKVMNAFQNPKNVGEIENADGKGMTVEEALSVTNKKVIETLGGLPPQKIHCSVLAEQAIKAAIEDYRSKQSVRA